MEFRRSLIVPLVIFLLALPACARVSMEEATDFCALDYSAPDHVALREETYCVSYWKHVLVAYPDLPAKVRTVLHGLDGHGREPSTPRAQVSLSFHTEAGTVSARAPGIQVLVTSLSTEELSTLLSHWKGMDARARALGIDVATYEQPAVDGAQVLVLSGDIELEVAGPSGPSKQFVDVHLEKQRRSASEVSIHAFGEEGLTAARALLEPRYSATTKLTVFMVGRMKGINVQGAEGQASQLIQLMEQRSQAGVHADLANRSTEAAQTAWAHRKTSEGHSLGANLEEAAGREVLERLRPAPLLDRESVRTTVQKSFGEVMRESFEKAARETVREIKREGR